jgi:hypothetical protein
MIKHYEDLYMFQVIDFTGFNKGDHWELRKNNQTLMSGKFKDIVRYAVAELGFDINDFDTAIQSVIYNSHNTLEFDRHKRLVSTCYIQVGKPKKIG